MGLRGTIGGCEIGMTMGGPPNHTEEREREREEEEAR